VLAGTRPDWIGPPAFTVPSSDGGLPALGLYPLCLGSDVSACQ
jgi:hypothetical protein